MRPSLPLQLCQRQGEPGHGVLVRLARRSGRLEAYRFASFLGMDARRLLTGHDVTVAAGLAGLSADVVSSWSPIVDAAARLVKLRGVTLADRDWSTHSRRYCPKCLAADVRTARAEAIEPGWVVHHRAIWDVTAIQSCPDHLCPLTDACWHCGQRQGWRFTDLCHCCRCKADLTAGPIGHHLDPVGGYIAGRMMGWGSDCNVLDALPLNDALRLCMRLGQAMRIGSVYTLPRQDRPSVLSDRTAGYHIARDLTERFSAVLDNLISVRPVNAPAGLLGAYGWIYGEWLTGMDLTAEVVRPIVYDHAVRNELMARDEARLGNTAPPTMCIKQVASEWGFGYERTRALLDIAGAIPPGSRAGVAFTIDPTILKTPNIRDTSCISVKAAAARLGTGAKQVRDMVAGGIIVQNSDGSVCVTALTNFEKAFAAKAELGVAPVDAVPIGKATNASAVPLQRLCRAILDGHVPVWYDAGSRVSGAMVRKADVRSLRRPKPDYSVERASQMLGLPPDCVRALHRDGIIPGPKARISAEGLGKFKQEFIAGSQWARSVGRKPKGAARSLAKDGLVPAFALKTYRQAIYRRCDLPFPPPN